MTADTPELFDGLLFVTVDELAKVVRLSKMTIYRMVRDGDLASRRFGAHTIRIPVADARALVMEGMPPSE